MPCHDSLAIQQMSRETTIMPPEIKVNYVPGCVINTVA